MEAITDVKQFVGRTQEFATSRYGNAHLKYWYRGQADATWELSPKLYRPSPTEPVLNNHAIWKKECSMMRNWRLMSASIRNSSASDEQLYFLAQHYGMPTRLLDWTTNPLIALYFASSGHKDANGKVFMLDLQHWELPRQPGGAPFGVASGRRPGFKAWMDHIFNWRNNKATRDNLISHTFPVRPEHFERRIILQQGCFTFHDPDHRIMEEKPPVQVLEIAKVAQEQILAELAALNINHFSVFGDLEHLAKHLGESWRL